MYQTIIKNLKKEIDSIASMEELSKVRNKYLGKNGLIKISPNIKNLSIPERKKLSFEFHNLKEAAEKIIFEKERELNKFHSLELLKNDAEELDFNVPKIGHLHPITQTVRMLNNLFIEMGYSVMDGPEIETDDYCFKRLNVPEDHPARDMQDTFYISDNIVLRTHTSPVQVRIMEKVRPPLRILSPGKVYRRDSDVSHTPMFHQIEGLLVDKGISFGDLKGILTVFLKKIFGENTTLRFRPSFFPFTEPSAEVDIRCVICGGQGCRVCKQSGWLEILGSGMVDPAVFRNVDYDSEEYTGFAFGLGLERIAMLKYGISDIRLFFENDIRFLRQF